MSKCSTVVAPPTPAECGLKCQPVAMLHCHTTTSILNHCHTALLDVPTPSTEETKTMNRLVGELEAAAAVVSKEPLLAQLGAPIRSAVFLTPAAAPLLEEFGKLASVKYAVDRAVHEAGVYAANGIKVMELENVAAPYFIGPGACPWEELVMLLLAARAVRAAHPDVCLGVHILSCNELEVLPIAIDVGAYFVRSEATLFEGVRPEGRTRNESNMARFLYCRRVLRQLLTSADDASVLRFPQIWSDVQKKHTVWADNLLDDSVWLGNIGFMKLEGLIVTGPETGSNVKEEALRNARTAADAAKAFVREKVAGASGAAEPELPVITGSGGDFEMYCKYADFMIIGTAFKEKSYWELPVSPANVAAVMERLRKAQP